MYQKKHKYTLFRLVAGTNENRALYLLTASKQVHRAPGALELSWVLCSVLRGYLEAEYVPMSMLVYLQVLVDSPSITAFLSTKGDEWRPNVFIGDS